MTLWVVPHLLWCFHGTVVSFRDVVLVVSRPAGVGHRGRIGRLRRALPLRSGLVTVRSTPAGRHGPGSSLRVDALVRDGTEEFLHGSFSRLEKREGGVSQACERGGVMKLSIVILCWNDLKVIPDCLRSIHATTRATEFGSHRLPTMAPTDGSIEFVRTNYPQVQSHRERPEPAICQGEQRRDPRQPRRIRADPEPRHHHSRRRRSTRWRGSPTRIREARRIRLPRVECRRFVSGIGPAVSIGPAASGSLRSA